MKEIPLRIDIAGGWLDVPKFSRENAYIVNCTFIPGVTKESWPYEFGGGLGGSAAKAILDGIDATESELKNGVGWQDPAVIKERGLCVWRSGKVPILEIKSNPDWWTDELFLYWTGNSHTTTDLLTLPRDYDSIEYCGHLAMEGVYERDPYQIRQAIRRTYFEVQLPEGMKELPVFGEDVKKVLRQWTWRICPICQSQNQRQNDTYPFDSMRLIVTGHREEKLATYDCHWIAVQLASLVGILMRDHGVSLAYSGMASGVDLYFCKACQIQKLPFIACIPFDGQELQMTEEARYVRAEYLKMASSVMHVKNSWMVEHCDMGLVVWDGNKGGTHNVVQQLVEKNVPFVWVNPVGQKVWHCT